MYVDFVAELLSKGIQPDGNNFQWVLLMDEYSNQQGSGAGVILEGPSELLIEQALRFVFKASNNQAEYEALIVGMLLAKELGTQSLLVKSDSLLVSGQVTGEYQAKDPQLASYLRYVLFLKAAFSTFQENKISEQTCYPSWQARGRVVGKGRSPRTTIDGITQVNHVEVLRMSLEQGRSNRSLT